MKTIQYRRKREGRTDYRKRLILLQAGKPRLVVRKSDKHMLAQIIEYNPDGDRVFVQAHSKELAKFGWDYGKKNLPACYLLGLLIGRKAAAKSIKSCILDIGLQTQVAKSRLYAVLKGAVDSGLDIPHSKEIFPDDKRLKGEHIAKYQAKGGQFSDYRSKGLSQEAISSTFDKVKQQVQNA
jgi:large subunit ribosomal protein L18